MRTPGRSAMAVAVTLSLSVASQVSAQVTPGLLGLDRPVNSAIRIDEIARERLAGDRAAAAARPLYLRRRVAQDAVQASMDHGQRGCREASNTCWVTATMLVTASSRLSRAPAPIDPPALARCQQDASDGDPFARYQLGRLYAFGIGVEENLALAVTWLRKAAEQGLPEAQSQLAWMIGHGCGVPKDEPEAARWYRRAADQGDLESQVRLGCLYSEARGVPHCNGCAIRWMQLAAARNHAGALWTLGLRYEYGFAVESDPGKAIAWYRRAAEQGFEQAQMRLAAIYRSGRIGLTDRKSLVPTDEEEAARWYRRAADQGHASACVALGEMYDSGRGVPKDSGQAARWYRLAARKPLVLMRRAASVLRERPAEGARLYRFAAEGGAALARYWMGLLHEYGNGVPQDGRESVRWYLAAADTVRRHRGATGRGLARTAMTRDRAVSCLVGPGTWRRYDLSPVLCATLDELRVLRRLSSPARPSDPEAYLVRLLDLCEVPPPPLMEVRCLLTGGDSSCRVAVIEYEGSTYIVPAGSRVPDDEYPALDVKAVNEGEVEFYDRRSRLAVRRRVQPRGE